MSSQTGRSFVQARSNNTDKKYGSIVVDCSDGACGARARAVRPHSAQKSDIAAVRTAARDEVDRDCYIVVEVHAQHCLLCRAKASWTEDDLLEAPLFCKIMVTAGDHQTAEDMLRVAFGINVSEDDLTRLKDKLNAHIVHDIEEQYRLLLPVLAKLENEHPNDFGAELAVVTTIGQEVVLLYGCFGAADKPRPPGAQLHDARVQRLVIKWPWANEIEPMGPPIVAMDAMHSKIGQGRVFNIAHRVAAHNMFLLTMWAEREDQASWAHMLRAAKRHLRVLLKPGTSTITDRGTALLAALDSVLDGVQFLYDVPHMKRNLIYYFPVLKRLKDKLNTLLNNVFYARFERKANKAIDKLMEHWPRLSGAHKNVDAPDEDPVAADDDDGGPDAPPRTFIGRGRQYANPEEYIRNGIGLKRFVAELMVSSNHDVFTSNHAEQPGSYLGKTVRRQSPARAIVEIINLHKRFFAEMASKAQTLKDAEEPVFASWPSHEDFETELAQVSLHRAQRITDDEWEIVQLQSDAGIDYNRKYHVCLYRKFAPEQPEWKLVSRGVFSCSGNPRPQVAQALNWQVVCALAARFPPGLGNERVPGVRRSNAELTSARRENGERYFAFVESLVAPYFRTSQVLEYAKLLLDKCYFTPDLHDIVPGAQLRPISTGEPTPVAKFDGRGGRKKRDPRLLSQGEADELAASGRPVKVQKRHCGVCRSRGVERTDHIASSKQCPFANVVNAQHATTTTTADGDDDDDVSSDDDE